VKHARLLVLAIALLVAAVAAACGGSSNDSSSSATSTDAAATPTKVRLVYFWPSIDFLSVPIVVAQQKGYFKDANLDVSLSLPPDSATATKVLGTGDADLGMVTTTDIAAAAQEDVPVMSIGNYTMSNNWGFFSKPGTPVSASTLKGKTISGFGDTWTNAMLPFVLEDAGLTESDVKIVTVTNDAPLLLNGKVDLATNTTNYLIPAVEDATGETPGLLLATDAGAPNVPIWVYAGNHDWLVENPEAAKAFMGAIAQATEWAIANPEEAVTLYEQAYPDNGGSNTYNLAGWTDTAKYMKNADGKLFVETDQQWTELGNALVSIGQLRDVQTPSTYYTNEYLPAG
jgi:ABC-type nitrate/sulfonate/bicarbonate transport system substrate-binding protein